MVPFPTVFDQTVAVPGSKDPGFDSRKGILKKKIDSRKIPWSLVFGFGRLNIQQIVCLVREPFPLSFFLSTPCCKSKQNHGGS